MKYTYFVSYRWSEKYGAGQGFGRCSYVTEKEISSFGDIERIEKILSDDVVNKLILNYQLLSVEEN